jgi:hypothetical protein
MNVQGMLPIREAKPLIERALEHVASAPRAERRYVIVESELTDKFVQFYGSKEEGIWLDLPFGTIGSSDHTVASGPIDRQMLISVTQLLMCPPDPGEMGEHSFMRKCASPAEGAELALQVLRKVHLLPRNVYLRILEDCSLGPN